MGDQTNEEQQRLLLCKSQGGESFKKVAVMLAELQEKTCENLNWKIGSCLIVCMRSLGFSKGFSYIWILAILTGKHMGSDTIVVLC